MISVLGIMALKGLMERLHDLFDLYKGIGKRNNNIPSYFNEKNQFKSP